MHSTMDFGLGLARALPLSSRLVIDPKSAGDCQKWSNMVDGGRCDSMDATLGGIRISSNVCRCFRLLVEIFLSALYFLPPGQRVSNW
jgi:hypothetical protein